MKKFFTAISTHGSKSVKNTTHRSQLEINIEHSRARAEKALKKINALPVDQQPKSVEPEQLADVMKEVIELRKDSVY